jgi:hypothetical protein
LNISSISISTESGRVGRQCGQDMDAPKEKHIIKSHFNHDSVYEHKVRECFEIVGAGAILFLRLHWVSYNNDLGTLERWNCAWTNSH